MTDKKFEIAQGKNLTLFNPAFIDDYGFTPQEFRVFARIMRRSSGEHSMGCYETIPKMAMSLEISERIVRESLQILRKCGAIRITEREGRSHLVTFQTCDKWLPKNQLIDIRHQVTGKRIERDRERKMTPGGNARGSGNARPPLAETLDKGIPIKGIPYIYNSEPQKNEIPWEYPMSFLIASFPEMQIMPAQIGYIEAEVKDTPLDREAWQNTITRYRQNHNPLTKSYLPEKIRNLLDVFQAEKLKLQGTPKNGTNNGHRATTTDRLRDTAEHLRANYPTEAELRENSGNDNRS